MHNLFIDIIIPGALFRLTPERETLIVIYYLTFMVVLSLRRNSQYRLEKYLAVKIVRSKKSVSSQLASQGTDD